MIKAKEDGVTATSAALAIGEQLSQEDHPLWPNRWCLLCMKTCFFQETFDKKIKTPKI